MSAVRVIVALEPFMYAEVLAVSLRMQRPDAEVTLFDPREDLGSEMERSRPHLVVANRVPPTAKESAFWVEVARARGHEPLGAEVSADGYSRSVRDVQIRDVIAALDQAREELARQAGSDEASLSSRESDSC